MKLLKLAAAVVNTTPLDWEGNKRNILAAIAAARAEGASLLCLPELCISGYGCEDEFHAPGVHATALEVLGEIVPATAGMVVSVGLPVFYRNALFNTAALLVDGRIAGLVAKRFLAGDGIHYEPRWFRPWPTGLVEQVEIGGAMVPVGDIHFDVGGVRIGFEICEDAWVAQRPGASLSLAAADVLLNPSASHFAFGKIETRKRFVIEGSRAFGLTYVYSNLVGNEAGRAIYDGGALIASGGKLLAAGKRFTYQDVLVTPAVVDIGATRMSQARTMSFTPSLAETPASLVKAAFSWPEVAWQASAPVFEAWESSAYVKEEEFTRAIGLALFDYLRKSRAGGFTVSLSGGVDSAAVSCLAALMIETAVAEIGREGFLQKLAHLPGLAAAPDLPALTQNLLTTVYQSTANSSATTLNAAKTLAAALHAEFLHLDVDPLVNAYTALAAKALDRELTWQRDDIALQNIQARTRSPGVWLIANLRNSLLLSTSNRSEAAVGYATMDGDTSGGLSPIAGIDKAFLRQWSRWLQTSGPHCLHPIPALANINGLPPTAELRPQEKKQTDEDDLMPYDLLDAIERAAIRDKRMPLEIREMMHMQFPQYSVEQLTGWIERFFQLWCRNQWKRERYAPSFHVDDENLDPKTWCRFPILSGGFARELAAMKAAKE
ncbi:MAG: NAD(+) synthase [Phycisphaerae bacterium]